MLDLNLCFDDRSTLRKLPRTHNAARNKSDSEIETSTASGNVKGANEEAVAGVEAIEVAIVNMIGVRYVNRGLHLLDVEAHHLAFVVLHPHVRLIHTFRLAEVVADQRIGGAGHLLLEDRLPSRVPDLGVHDVGDTKMTIRDHAVDILQADRALLPAGIMAGIGIRELGDVVMIERDPIRLQKPLAHVRSDEVEKDAPAPYRLIA